MPNMSALDLEVRSPSLRRSGSIEASDKSHDHPNPALAATATVVGGGIAGYWVALNLAKRGVSTILLCYSATDRGGKQGATIKSVGAINTSPTTDEDFRATLEQLSKGQANDSIAQLMQEHLADELNDLRQYADLEEIKIGVRLEKGNARRLLERLRYEFEVLGGKVIDGWVTRIVADENQCRGIQYQSEKVIGKVKSQFVIIASGGYAGLFEGAVKTACFGTVIGQAMRSGAFAANLEFLFKHGFGKPDSGQLTPTEQLRGAAIFDEQGEHIEWLERALYEGQGTKNHERAVLFWRQHGENKFYISECYRELYSRIRALEIANGTSNTTPAFKSVLELFPADSSRLDARRLITQALLRTGRLSYDDFCLLRRFLAVSPADSAEQIRQISYFSMGGLAHDRFQTNLKNVFVTGEAMHDFGANRVGGLPWGLYLVAGSVIARRIENSAVESTLQDFEAIRQDCAFDNDVLIELRKEMKSIHDGEFDSGALVKLIQRIKIDRAESLKNGNNLSDAVSWLIVAEAILKSSLMRKESRGCFLRDDFPNETPCLGNFISVAKYDKATDSVICQLVPREILDHDLKTVHAGGKRYA